MSEVVSLTAGEVQEREAQVIAFDPDAGVVEARLVPYEIEAQLDEQTREVFTRGAFARADVRRVKVSDQQHNRAVVIGHAIELRDDEDGLYGKLRISDTTHGRDTLTLLRDGVLTEVSIEFTPQRRYMRVERRGNGYLVRHDRATLLGVSPVSHGAYGAGARVLAVRAAELLAEHEAELEAEEARRRERLEAIRAAELAELNSLTAGRIRR